MITYVHIGVPFLFYLVGYRGITHSRKTYFIYGVKTWATAMIVNSFYKFRTGEYETEFYKLIIFLGFFDFWFYWTHRAFHSSQLYYIHKIHHIAVNPSPFDALVVEPIEGLITTHIPSLFLLNMLNIHILNYKILVLVSHFFLFFNHSKLDKNHLNHHKYFNRNYSIFTDYLFGTY